MRSGRLSFNLQAKSKKSELGNMIERGVCMLPKRQQIYFTSNFWFHDFEQLCQLVYLQYNSKPSCNCHSVTRAQIEYLERRFSERKQRVYKRNSCFCKYFKAGRTTLIRSGFLSVKWFQKLFFRTVHWGKITALRENNLNWHGLGVRACQIQLFNSLDVYLQHNFSQLY